MRSRFPCPGLFPTIRSACVNSDGKANTTSGQTVSPKGPPGGDEAAGAAGASGRSRRSERPEPPEPASLPVRESCVRERTPRTSQAKPRAIPVILLLDPLRSCRLGAFFGWCFRSVGFFVLVVAFSPSLVLAASRRAYRPRVSATAEGHKERKSQCPLGLCLTSTFPPKRV